MPRRVYTYADGMGWNWLNLITTLGSYVFAAGVLLLIINIVSSYRRGRPAGDNPWDAPTLEWATTSPPPPYNFAVIPTVASRHPLWEGRLGEPQSRQRSSLTTGFLLDHGRETLGTTPLEAEPDLILKMPADSYTPVILAVSLTTLFTGLVLHAWWLAAAGALAAAADSIAWLWPDRSLGQTASAADG
jgi:cytochrome c oxidase subunit 1/cytochrome c oxidase subunit I+III